jgi:hypothetical protein
MLLLRAERHWEALTRRGWDSQPASRQSSVQGLPPSGSGSSGPAAANGMHPGKGWEGLSKKDSGLSAAPVQSANAAGI